MSIKNLIFVGFNSRVLALDRYTGEIVWHWQCPKPKMGGYVTLLLDGDRLIVAVQGYIYCLNPASGEQLWYNPTKGFETGVTSIATVRGHSAHDLSARVAEEITAAAAASAGPAGAGY